MFTLRVAEHNFRIDNQYSYVLNMSRDYIIDDDVSAPLLSATQSEIERERDELYDSSPGYLESLAIYRKMCESLIEADCILFHASALSIDGSGVMFTAKSGTGKSTHSRMWRERFGDRVTMINDDKPILKVGEDGVVVYGTPWCGKHGLQKNTSVKVKAICLLERGEKNSIAPLETIEAFPTLFSQTYRPSDEKLMRSTIHLVGKLSSAVKLFRLRCNISHEAAQCAYEMMKETF